MTDLEDFEADMIRLLMVWMKVMTINKEFPKLTEKGEHGNLVRAIFREYTVINLVNFIKVRRDLLKNEDFKKLDDVIKPLVEPILEHETAIFQLRNQYIAHVQEEGRKFKVTINDIITKNKFPTNFGFYRYLAGLAFFYCGVVERNFSDVWISALKKYEVKAGSGVTLSSGYKMADTKQKLLDILASTQVKLFDEGFVASLTPEEIEKIRPGL